MQVVWNGTLLEGLNLINAAKHNCACDIRGDLRLSICAVHLMLANDQRALDGLLFARRIWKRLHDEEFLRAKYAILTVGHS
jgi:hypothetical protein